MPILINVSGSLTLSARVGTDDMSTDSGKSEEVTLYTVPTGKRAKLLYARNLPHTPFAHSYARGGGSRVKLTASSSFTIGSYVGVNNSTWYANTSSLSSTNTALSSTFYPDFFLLEGESLKLNVSINWTGAAESSSSGQYASASARASYVVVEEDNV